MGVVTGDYSTTEEALTAHNKELSLLDSASIEGFSEIP